MIKALIMNKQLVLFFCLFFLGCIFSPYLAQTSRTFGAGLKLGSTFCQIDGDDSFGFNRFGVTAGIFGTAKLNKLMNLGIEFLYSQRGSRSSSKEDVLVGIKLNYLEIPVLLQVNDWMIETDRGSYHRIRFEGGLSLGRLLSASTLNNLEDRFSKNDISWILGSQYFWHKNWSISGRYTSSWTPIYKFTDPSGNPKKLKSYFLSLGLQFHFN